MSVLVKPDIIKEIGKGRIVIAHDGKPLPAEDLHIGPNSIDLHLHREMRKYVGYLDQLDARKDNPTERLEISDRGYILLPGELYIARTIESTYTPHHVPFVGGRSSIGRLGLSVHQTAGFGDVGFRGTWTLEISVIKPVKIYPGMRIAQLWFFTTSSELAEKDRYQGRYQDQEDATAYRGHWK